MSTGNDPPDLSGVGVGELSRLVRDVLVRFEGLAARLETQFVRTDNFEYYKQLINSAITTLQQTTTTAENKAIDKAVVTERFVNLDSDIASKASKSDIEALTKRVKDLEDDKTWLVRLILSFVVLGVLAAAFTVAKVSGGG